MISNVFQSSHSLKSSKNNNSSAKKSGELKKLVAELSDNSSLGSMSQPTIKNEIRNHIGEDTPKKVIECS